MNSPDTQAGFAVDLSPAFAVIRFDGDDAAGFLHGQLSCHVTGLAVPGATLGSYNTAKGRMLASFLLVRMTDGFAMVLHASIAAAIRKRLAMFVLRSKVRIADAADALVPIGLAGSARDAGLAASRIDLPATDWAAASGAAGTWVALPPGRALGLVPREGLDGLRAAIASWADPVAWARLDIAAGIPWITTATQDQLVAQMANLERIGGVHFQKGCYPGQEIIARTQHLGRIKRRMQRGHVEAAVSDAPPAPGDPVYGTDVGDQASGLVVNVAPAADGGFDLLAVMQTTTAAAGAARLRAIDGPPIALAPLPYPID